MRFLIDARAPRGQPVVGSQSSPPYSSTDELSNVSDDPPPEASSGDKSSKSPKQMGKQVHSALIDAHAQTRRAANPRFLVDARARRAATPRASSSMRARAAWPARRGVAVVAVFEYR